MRMRTIPANEVRIPNGMSKSRFEGQASAQPSHDLAYARLAQPELSSDVHKWKPAGGGLADGCVAVPAKLLSLPVELALTPLEIARGRD